MNLQGMQIWMVTPRSDTPVGHRGQIKVKLRSNLEIAENLTNLLNQSGTYNTRNADMEGGGHLPYLGSDTPVGQRGQMKVKFR